MYKKLAERYFSFSSLLAYSNRNSNKNVDTSPSQIVNKKSENIKFNKLFAIRYIFSCRRVKSLKIDLFEKAKIKIDNIIDINTYIRTIMEFEFIKNNMINDNQFKRLNSIQKELIIDTKQNFLLKRIRTDSINECNETMAK